ncbi:MAG: DUF4279 domain-containing protein [Gaiellaceae bacterium]
MSTLEESANCDRTYASFLLNGGAAFNTAEITKRIGIDPHFAVERGGRCVVISRAVVEPSGTWLISTREMLESTSVERHLIALLEIVEPVRDELRALRAEMKLELDFFCYWASAYGHGGPEISPHTLRRIADLDATLCFDFYDLSSNDRPKP